MGDGGSAAVTFCAPQQMKDALGLNIVKSSQQRQSIADLNGFFLSNYGNSLHPCTSYLPPNRIRCSLGFSPNFPQTRPSDTFSFSNPPGTPLRCCQFTPSQLQLAVVQAGTFTVSVPVPMSYGTTKETHTHGKVLNKVQTQSS